MGSKGKFLSLILFIPVLFASVKSDAHTRSKRRYFRVASPAGVASPVYVTHRRMSLDAQASCNSLPDEPVYCRFRDPRTGKAMSWLIFDPRSGTVWTRAGYPRPRTRIFTGVSTVVGLPPYGDGGFSLVAFGDVALASIRLKNNSAHVPLFSYIFEHIHRSALPATWGAAPGGPSGVVDAGRCYVGQPGYHSYQEFVNW